MKISLVKPVSGYNLAAINDNFVKLEQELQDKVLYRDNPVGEPNAVVTDLDMNGKRILNLSELQVGGVNISGLNSAVVWRGTWSGATAYARNDAVYHSGSSYICVTPNTNSAPPSANWNLFAAQGATGAGTGDVLGPASATLDTVATYASGTGKMLKASGVAISSLALAGPLGSSGITGAAASGLVTASGLTQSTARMLGRTTAATGAVEEISIGKGLTLAGGSLSVSGRLVAQIQTFQTGTVALGTTVIPADNTIPQITEGDQYFSLAFTPTNASSTLEIDVQWIGSNGAGSTTTVALFEVGTANALAAAGHAPGSLSLMSVPLKHLVSAGSTSARTYTVRAGSSSGSTLTFNGVSAGQFYGGIIGSRITVKEYLP